MLLLLAVMGASPVAVGPAVAEVCRTVFEDYVVATDAVTSPSVQIGSTQAWVSASHSQRWQGPGDLPIANTTAIGYRVVLTALSGQAPPVMRSIPLPANPEAAAVPWKSVAGSVGSAGVAVSSFGPYPTGSAYKVAMSIEFDRPIHAFRFAAMDLDWIGERVSHLRFFDANGNAIRLSSLHGEARNFAEPAPQAVPELAADARLNLSPGWFTYHAAANFTFDPTDDSVGRPPGVSQRAWDSSASLFAGLADDIAISGVAFDFNIEGIGAPRFNFSGRDDCNHASGVPALDSAAWLAALTVLLVAVASVARIRRGSIGRRDSND